MNDFHKPEVVALLTFPRQISESIFQGSPIVEFIRDEIGRNIAMLQKRIN